MYDCNCLIHPFQNDPGTSQRERVMEELLSGTAKIDARTLADLLDYFVQLSRHINYYDGQLNISDWQPFFKNSIPFTLASVINYKPEQTETDFTFYNSLFEKKPSSTGLQLQAYFIFYHFINKINYWHLAVKGSGLPIEKDIQVLIKDKLQNPVKDFISYTNAAVKWYNIKKIDFLKLYENEVWNLDLTDLYSVDNSFKNNTQSKHQQLINLYNSFKNIFPSFFSAVKILSLSAENNLEQSLLPLKDELQKTHPPHLGLLFAFLNMFRQLQNDLNGYTRRHLDFFYKDVLQIKSREAVADKTHVLFEVQKQLEKYLIKKGTLVKDGKDNNKQEILFSLDDDIVVNKTTLAETRTLFLNNQNAHAQTYVEGVYMAQDATKADGIDKDFTDEQPKNFFTLGSKLSKYNDPETKIIKPYSNARIGFILASPVLYLQEGTRTVDITLACELNDSICKELESQIISAAKNCCNEETSSTKEESEYPDFYPATKFYNDINNALNQTYYYISQDLIKEAVKKGISKDLANILIETFLTEITTLCYCPEKKLIYDAAITQKKFNDAIQSLSQGEQIILASIFKPRKALTILFSGEKEWIEPSEINMLQLEQLITTSTSTKFLLHIKASLNPDKAAVTFYNKDNLKEDFGTTQPLVKIDLDDKIKLIDISLKNKIEINDAETNCCTQKDACCILNDETADEHTISLYHFFRNVEVIKKIGTNNTVITDDTRISVQVCGLKNFIVQNDESVQDVNGPLYPFGTRPDLIDFSVQNNLVPASPNLIGPNFYIGSKEVFCKKWIDVRINFNWKDKPSDFKEYYKAYWVDPGNAIIFGLNSDGFKINISYLDEGNWTAEPANRKLFDLITSATYIPLCSGTTLAQVIVLANPAIIPNHKFSIDQNKLVRFDVNSRNGFIKINLREQDFLHKDYSFVLARQMMAFGKLPDDHVESAVYYDSTIPGGGPIVISTTAMLTALNNSGPIASRVHLDVKDINDNKVGANGGGDITGNNPQDIRDILRLPNTPASGDLSLNDGSLQLDNTINTDVIAKLNNLKKFAAIIPNEPWTPIISNMALDYTATATIEDIDLIHLYPYTGTYKHEEIELQPTLFPTFCDEGTLFLGLKELVPGNNLNILFQLAEATSDSESDKEEVHWHYLDSNIWKPLSKGFEVLDDASENLTASGIIKFAMPANMTKDNTVMPKDLYWIKATIAKNSKAVAETTGIHPQAMLATFTNDDANDKLRLSKSLAAGSISKLNEADAYVKSVQQPYEAFDGSIPEMEGGFYVRVSEHLRHKGRAIQKFDYERLVLEAFPQVFKAKCINHSFALDAHIYTNDFPYAPGYIILAVIPDLYKLKAGNSFEPKVPVSIIEKIEAYIRKRTSPFVRFRAMNPRFEKINFCLRIKLMPGKDENYYREKLKQDLKELLAPWAVGEYDKLTFGQCIYRSDIIRFLERRDYVDYINDFRMGKESGTPADIPRLCPDTPRSILIAGEIEVCIEAPECENWLMDENGNIINPCETELIPVADYCEDKIVTTG